MNKSFHSVWNASKQAYVAAAETVSAKGKSSSGVKVAAVVAGLMGSLLGQVANGQTAPPANALPTGGQVSAGQASIGQSGANMAINQTSNRAALNWQTFNVGKDAKVQFAQPNASSVTLNRVLSNDPSQIFGQITSNGQVILTNPAGVYFGASARLDVGGLIATTHRMSDADFMAGKNRLERNGSTGSVVNDGEIKAALGGYIALLAPEVRNQGAVIAQMGTVALAAGEAFDLKFDSNNRLTSLRVEASQIQALVDNRHAIKAPGGLVIISAQSMDRMVGGVVNNSGNVEATGLQQQGGRIVLSGSTRVQNAGSLDASSTEAGGKGGRISLQGDSIALETGSRISATGPTGGGMVLVGGNWQGSADPLLQATAQPTAAATTVRMASGATIDASATQNGDGGKVVLWSDVKAEGSETDFAGQIRAQGGSNSGQGGRVETSGHTLRVAETAGVNSLAPKGNAGQWLLDPIDFTISAGSGGQTTSGIGATTLAGNLLTTNVAIETDASPGGNGDIRVNAAVTQAAANSLTLTAHRDINVYHALSIGGGITLNAGRIIMVNNNLSSTATNSTGISLSGTAIVQGSFSVTTQGSPITYSVTNSPQTSSTDYALLVANNASFNASGGNINLSSSFAVGGASGTQDDAAVLFGDNSIVRTSGSGNIIVTGNASNLTTTGNAMGIYFSGGNTLVTDSGALTLNLYRRTTANSDGLQNWAGASLLSQSGSISIVDLTPDGSSSGTQNSITSLRSETLNIGAVSGSSVTTSTSDITIQANKTINPNALRLNTGGNIVFESAGSTFSAAQIFPSISGSPSSVRMGKSTNTADVTVGTAITATGPISINGGAITINAPITATNSQITLKGGTGKAVTDGTSGFVVASELLLLGGNVTLDHGSNNVGTLAASGVGSLTYIDSNALTIGTVGATSGIGATGAVSVSTLTGDLTLAGNINTTSTTSSAILLNAGKSTAPGTASGGNLLISGTPTLSVGTGGRISLMTGSVTGSTGLTSLSGLTAGTGRFRYNADEPINFASAPWTNLSSGVYGIYREQPTATPNNLNQVITYGDSFNLSTSASGLVNGDTMSQSVASAVYSSGRLNANATPYSISNNLTGLGYSVSANTLTVNRKALTASGLTSANKVYDGTTTAAVSGTAVLQAAVATGTSSDGIPFTGDTVSLTGTAVGNFNTKDVLTANTVTFTGLSLTGAQAGNYSLTQHANATMPRITRLNSVTWVGGASGNWFEPANWAGGAVPDLANVANVVIPSGVTVSFGSTVVAPAQSGAVSIDGLTGAGGNLSQTAGTLNVGSGGITLGNLTQSAGTMANTGSTTLDAFTQSGGSFTGTGNMTTASFAQTGGSTSLLANLAVTQDFNQGSLGNVSVGGNATITDTVGGLQLGNFSSTVALAVNSTDGAITQASGTALSAQSTSSFTATQGGQPAAIDLSNAGNNFGGAVSLSGSNVSIVDANALILGNVTATGNLNATAATDLAVNGVVSANTLTLTATTGSMTQGAGSTITVATGPSNFVAGGTVTLGRTNSFTGSVNGWGDNSSPGPVPPGTPETPQVDTGNTVGVILSGNARSITSPGTTLTSSSAPPELVLSASAGTSSAKSSQQSNVSNANSEGVTIDVRNAAVQDEPIMAAVSLPKGSATSGTGFSFELPSNLRELVQTPDNVQATLPNGGPLPAWLKFNAQALRFEASAVPNGAFPMQVAIQLGKQRVMVVISERTE